MAIAGYALFLWLNVGAYATGADSSGYFNHARLLAEGRLHLPQRTVPGLAPAPERSLVYVPHGFKLAPDSDLMVPSYPVGLPLLIVVAVPLAGWTHAGALVIVLHSLAGVLLTFALGRALGLPRNWSVIGAAMIASSPLYVHYSLHAMSDMPAMVWTTLAVFFAWRCREKTPWALAAGASLAMAVLIRPSNVLAFVPVGIALGGSWRRWLLLGAGGLPGALFFCLHSQSIYGSPFMTGYEDVAALFERRWIALTFWHYLRWLPVLFTPVVLLVPALPWLARALPRQAALLGTWALAYLAFYSAYLCTHETWWFLRFVLPAAPALVLGGLFVVRHAGARWRLRLNPVRAFGLALTFIGANSVVWMDRLDALDIGRDEKIYPEIVAWLRGHVPDNAMIVCSQMTGAVTYYSDLTFLRCDQYDSAEFRRMLPIIEATGRPLFAVLFPFEVDETLRRRMPGHWRQIGARSVVSIWRRAPGGTDAPRLEIDETADAALQAPPPSYSWELPVDSSPRIVLALNVLNFVAWLAVARLLWPWFISPGRPGGIALAGVLLSAGALGSLRFGSNDLVALLAVAGAMKALEQNRPGRAALWLSAGGVAGESSLLALPCLRLRPSRPPVNAAQVAGAIGPFLVLLTVVLWRSGALRHDLRLLDWPMKALLEKWWTFGLREIPADPLSLRTWSILLILTGLTTQAAYFFWSCSRHVEPWWRLGMIHAIAMLCLGVKVWQGFAGNSARLLLPMTLAFNRLALNGRAPLAWLLAGNLTVVGGLVAFFKQPDRLQAISHARTAGWASLVLPRKDWYALERNDRHEWVWSRGDALLELAMRSPASREMRLDFALSATTTRSVVIQSGGRILWRRSIGPSPASVSVPVRIAGGKADLAFILDPPEPAAVEGRLLGFALYDPVLQATPSTAPP